MCAHVSPLQDFLSTSQLTYHGLTELHQALQPGQLAVFFRNNHFGARSEVVSRTRQPLPGLASTT